MAGPVLGKRNGPAVFNTVFSKAKIKKMYLCKLGLGGLVGKVFCLETKKWTADGNMA